MRSSTASAPRSASVFSRALLIGLPAPSSTAALIFVPPRSSPSTNRSIQPPPWGRTHPCVRSLPVQKNPATYRPCTLVGAARIPACEASRSKRIRLHIGLLRSSGPHASLRAKPPGPKESAYIPTLYAPSCRTHPSVPTLPVQTHPATPPPGT